MARPSSTPRPVRGPIFSPRFIVALVLMLAGIAWMAYYTSSSAWTRRSSRHRTGKPAFMADLGNWNYLIGFGLLFVGLVVSAPLHPLGRGSSSACWGAS